MIRAATGLCFQSRLHLFDRFLAQVESCHVGFLRVAGNSWDVAPTMTPDPSPDTTAAAAYWRRNLTYVLTLLAI